MQEKVVYNIFLIMIIILQMIDTRLFLDVTDNHITSYILGSIILSCFVTINSVWAVVQFVAIYSSEGYTIILTKETILVLI